MNALKVIILLSCFSAMTYSGFSIYILKNKKYKFMYQHVTFISVLILNVVALVFLDKLFIYDTVLLIWAGMGYIALFFAHFLSAIAKSKGDDANWFLKYVGLLTVLLLMVNRKKRVTEIIERHMMLIALLTLYILIIHGLLEL